MVYESHQRNPDFANKAILPIEEMRNAIPRLERCISELARLDLGTTGSAMDPNFNVRGLENSINNIIAEIFGQGTPEYRFYQAGLVPLVFTNDVDQVRESYRQRILKTSIKLQEVTDTLRRKITAQNRQRPRKSEEQPREAKHSQAPSDSKTHNIIVMGLADQRESSAVAEFLDKLDLLPVLFEWPKSGIRLAESMEGVDEADFALVFLSSEREGNEGGTSSRKLAPSRDALLLLGYLAGKLGEESVCALCVPGLSLPSSGSGIGRVKLDERGAWQLELARLFKGAGLKFDLNKAL